MHKSSPICWGGEHGSNCKGFGKLGAECDNRSSLRAQSELSGDISAPGERNAGITVASPPQDWWWRQRARCSGISPTQKQPDTPRAGRQRRSPRSILTFHCPGCSLITLLFPGDSLRCPEAGTAWGWVFFSGSFFYFLPTAAPRVPVSTHPAAAPQRGRTAAVTETPTLPGATAESPPRGQSAARKAPKCCKKRATHFLRAGCHRAAALRMPQGESAAESKLHEFLLASCSRRRICSIAIS